MNTVHLQPAGIGWGQWTGVVALFGLAVAVAGLALLHFAPTGLSPMRNAVSQYGISNYRWGYRSATMGLAISAAAVAVGIGELHNGKGFGAVVALLVIFAICRAVISWIPMDAPGTPRTSTGHSHGLIAIVTFGTAAAAALRLGQLLPGADHWRALAPAAAGFGWAMIVCIGAMILTRRDETVRRYFGLVERGLYVGIIGWLAMLAVALV